MCKSFNLHLIKEIKLYMFKKIGFLVSDHPWLTILTWTVLSTFVILFAVVGVGGQNLFERLITNQPSVESESNDADTWLADNGGAKTEAVILILEKGQLDDVSLRNVADDFVTDVDRLQSVESTVSPLLIPEEALLQVPELKGFSSDNGVLVVVNVLQEGNDNQNREDLDSVLSLAEEYVPLFEKTTSVTTASVANATLFGDSIVEAASEDLKNGELIAFPLAMLILVLVFGGFIAAGMPLLGAVVSIVGGLGVLFGASFFLDVDTSVLNVLTVIGLGLSIDYGLLMVSRFREQLRLFPKGDKKQIQLAVVNTLNTAGRTVFFSGLTITICTSALVFFEASLMKSIAVSAAGVILLAILTSLTLLPAIFSLLGYKLVNPSPLTKVPGLGKMLKKFGDTAPQEGVFSWLADRIRKRALPVFVLATAFLVLLGSSIVGLHVSNYGTPYLAKSEGQQQLFETLTENYDAFTEYDLTLVFDKNKVEVDELVPVYESFLAEVDDVVGTPVFNGQEDNRYATLSFNTTDVIAGQLVVGTVRDFTAAESLTGEVLLTGNPARDVDFNNSLLSSAPLVVSIIVLATFILLFLMTGSLFIPLKAIVLSALSLGASIGVITWGFEGGNLAGVLNFDASQIVGISPLILVLILVFGFGLAMDYEVFLISRIKEEYDKTGDSQLAIRAGLQGSGRIITSAGVIIAVVFMGFAFGNMLFVKQIGVALAIAIIIDMTIVRCLMVPSIMSMMGDKAWWAPKGLKKVQAKLNLEH